MRPRTVRAALLAAAFAGGAVGAVGADVVILKDGFVVQGTVQKEVTSIIDKASGKSVPIIKSNGFDIIDEGPKFTIFSSHARQLGAIAPDTKLRPDVKGYTMPYPGTKSRWPLPVGGATTKITDYNAKWIRTMTVAVPGAAPEKIEQQITYMDPYFIRIISPTHVWRQGYRTCEWEPKLIRKLLVMHPDLAEPDGKCDPLKRVMIAKFMLDAGWLQVAKDELERLKTEFPGAMPNNVQTEYEKLLKEIDQTTVEEAVREAELALAAGRYKYTAGLLAAFPERTAGPKEVARAAKVTADLKTGQQRYDDARRLLRRLIDDTAGNHIVNAWTAAGSGLALTLWRPPPGTTPETLELARAAEQVYSELHQDSAVRIETFVTLAAQAERQRGMGQEPTKKPDELLATAVSGWAKGKNGATPNPESALKLWRARELVLTYQRGENLNDRTALLNQFKRTPSIPIDELAQMISLLPPALPEDLDDRTGTPVPIGRIKDSGLYRRKTRPTTGFATGLDYLVRLPPEYHHGRAYPVLVVLTHPGIPTEEVLTPIIPEADRNGYILVVPEWTGLFGNGWQWKGEDHVWVTAALRDTVRHFTVDNDRVFMVGVGEGANMAMDVGASHPDLFAGVIPMGPIPKWNGLFMHYWANMQKLPLFVITGEQSGDGITKLRSIYEKLAPYGYPALWSLYKGRGVEWFAAETPVLFDWMARKTRVNGTATLALGTGVAARQPWQMFRETDNRFYWLQADKIIVGTVGGTPTPATIQGDIRGSNEVDIKTSRVNNITVWLSSDLIDWTKPVSVRINGSEVTGRKPPVVQPSLEVLLEDYHDRGDRRALFLNKLEFAIK